MKKNLLTLGAFLMAMSFFASCASVPKEIPADEGIEELKQHAYEYSSKGYYAAAEKYYETIIERYGMNASVLISAEYEIAHLYVKQNKYEEAEPRLNKILNYYALGASSLPAQYKRLAELDLEKVKNPPVKTMFGKKSK